jgi:hypothetical protein
MVPFLPKALALLTGPLHLLDQPLEVSVMLCPLLSPIPSLLLTKCQASQLPLLGLHFQYLVFDGVFDDQTDDFASSRLAEAVDSVDGLVFDCRCPPGVAKDDLHRC